MIRCFIAVELPENLREEVALFQSELEKSGADVKWVGEDNLHLTIKFLGNMEETQVAALKEALAGKLGGFGSFILHLDGVGAFPRTTGPRVLWVGVHEGKDRLEELAKEIEAACSELNLPPEERPFSAHLTVGRVRSNNRLAPLIKQLQIAEFRSNTPAPVSQVTLFQSKLSPKGSVYTPLAEIPLEEPTA